MAKQPPKIRWRDSDTAELQRVINNFNAKLYRLNKKDPESAKYLPDRLKKSEVIKSIETRADFNRVLNSYKRFSKRGAESPVKSSRGAKSTKWEVSEEKRKNAIINRQKADQYEKLREKPQLSRGKPTGNKMGSIKVNELTPRQVNFENMSDKEWQYKKTLIDRKLNPLHNELDKRLYRQNYVKGLRNAGFSDDIVAMVQEVDIDTFLEITQRDKEADIDFIYDELEDWELHQEVLYQVWEQALKESKGEK